MYTNQASSSSVAHPCMNKKECPKASGERTERRKTTSHSPRAPTCKAGGQKRRKKEKKTIIAWTGRRGKLRNLLFGRFVRLACC